MSDVPGPVKDVRVVPTYDDPYGCRLPKYKGKMEKCSRRRQSTCEGCQFRTTFSHETNLPRGLSYHEWKGQTKGSNS